MYPEPWWTTTSGRRAVRV